MNLRFLVTTWYKNAYEMIKSNQNRDFDSIDIYSNNTLLE